jgi:hypothetical protein
MSADAEYILSALQRVDCERRLRIADSELWQRVHAVKSWQHARFERTYADLLDDRRYAQAARFFLEELYGPGDFTRRDAQFARVVPGLVRLFPQEIVTTVRLLAELHATSEELDTIMGRAVSRLPLDRHEYVRAWQHTGRREDRERQIDLVIAIGKALDRHTRRPMLRRTLHLMRVPARAIGLAELQRFLESGFDTFGAMGGAEEFLGIVSQRERQLAQALFSLPADRAADGVTDNSGVLASLPD